MLVVLALFSVLLVITINARFRDIIRRMDAIAERMDGLIGRLDTQAAALGELNRRMCTTKSEPR